jgi:hypothetical protein
MLEQAIGQKQDQRYHHENGVQPDRLREQTTQGRPDYSAEIEAAVKDGRDPAVLGAGRCGFEGADGGGCA